LIHENSGKLAAEGGAKNGRRKLLDFSTRGNPQSPLTDAGAGAAASPRAAVVTFEINIGVCYDLSRFWEVSDPLRRRLKPGSSAPAASKAATMGERQKGVKNMISALRTMLAVIAALSSAIGFAQDAKNQGYLLDQNMNIVTSATTGLCVRTSDWTPARAVAQCDPDLVKKPAPPAPKAAPAPAPKKEAPKPTAQPKKEAPPKLLPQKINFSADALFDFDKAALRPEGRAMLDELTRLLKGAKYEVILAIGHTDRIGTAAYNQKLSVRRAEAVKKYLTEKGIPPNRVYAEGKGKTQPLTKPSDCMRGLSREQLIACLQRDRRVDVDVTGTK
jgi:OOP family OmpA-OmpF porin